MKIFLLFFIFSGLISPISLQGFDRFLFKFVFLCRHRLHTNPFFLYPQSQYVPPDASVYSLTKSEAPPSSLIV